MVVNMAVKKRSSSDAVSQVDGALVAFLMVLYRSSKLEYALLDLTAKAIVEDGRHSFTAPCCWRWQRTVLCLTMYSIASSPCIAGQCPSGSSPREEDPRGVERRPLCA